MLLQEDPHAKENFDLLSEFRKNDILHRAENIVTLNGMRQLISYKLK